MQKRLHNLSILMTLPHTGILRVSLHVPYGGERIAGSETTVILAHLALWFVVLLKALLVVLEKQQPYSAEV